MTSTRAAYTARAVEYIDLLGSMARVHPSDRQIVDSWAASVTGSVLDAGCGPGHWAGYLAGLGLDARGIDLVPAFIEHARSSYPGVPFALQSIDSIEEPDESFGGVLSWFSTIHHAPEAIATPISEFARVLRPGGRLALGFFSADVLEPFDHAVLRAYRWPPDELRRVVEASGFEVIEVHSRKAREQRPVGAIVCERRSAG